ncbi:hypothetical protein RA8P1_00083 (plasmid) [Variovorax sp. RA8]|nr:hypothetical protein RA8P1_00083 [Variovorax sp. RA8]
MATDAFVYLVDTGNLWVAAAAILPAQLASLRDEVDEARSTALRALAAAAMARASQAAQPKAGSMALPETLQAFAAGLRAIAAAEQSPELDNHHWILLLYRLIDGEVLAGFGHIDDPVPGMLEREMLVEYVGTMVEMDVASDGTIINAAVRQARGVQLAPALRHLAAGGF